MRKRTGDFGHLKLILAFLFISVVLPNVVKAFDSSAAGALGSFEANETGIKLCAQIDAGPEDALHFRVSNNQGYSTDLVVANNSCAHIDTEAATYTIKQRALQEYSLTSVAGGTVSADSTPFIATASGQYTIIYSSHYAPKSYLHSFGYTVTKNSATAMDIHFDANGGTGTMNDQRFGINASQALTANAFTRAGYTFDGWNTAADGSGTSYANLQSVSFANGGKTTLYAQWLSLRATDVVARQVNDLSDYQINFTKKAIVSSDVATANGNGVNKYTENGQDIYYFRGQIDNNNVIWADKCWKIVRTTYAGGTKIIYNGTPTDVVVDGNITKQCLATGLDSQITVNVDGADINSFKFNNNDISPADVGYMYGARLVRNDLTVDNEVFTFSNNVSRSGNTYTLDTSDGQSISGTWVDKRLSAAARYHYFCIDGSTTCDNTKIGYIHYYGNAYTIYYLKIGGYNDIEDAKNAMFANTNDSNAKAMVETWFEQQNLDGHLAGSYNYENDLEDAVFCNERSYYSGALESKDGDITPSKYDLGSNMHSAAGRNTVMNSQNNYEPSLDCFNKNDSFTKDDTANGNGKLNHKVGLITADELTMAGIESGYDDYSLSFLNTGQFTWSMSPSAFSTQGGNFAWTAKLNGVAGISAIGLRPMVSLKAGTTFANNGADGTTTNPYIVE
jgi:uncharacterized repeat protein (TIGR02543 family)